MIRAAADGDAQAVRALLAEGADVNGSTQGGQTPLMLAAVFGHADIVCLLLDAGADVQLRDGLGLRAMEWSERRGFSKITKLLANASPPGRVRTRANATEDQTSLEADTDRGESATEVKITPKQAIGRSTEAFKGIKADQEGPKAEEARPKAEDLARIKARVESHRILEESRKRVEEEVRKRSLRETRGIGQEEPPDQPSGPAAAIEPGTSESPDSSHIKRCPKCNTIYESGPVAYCAYDATVLISADDPSFNPAAHALGRPTLWVLVAITLVGSAFIAYLLNNYLSKEKSSGPIAVRTEEPANAKKDLPTIGGALSGKEINLPNPEYPTKLKSEGTSGTVTVEIRVNKKGIVISARALNGHPLLRAAAVEAAKRATFSPEKLTGDRGVVTGTITYTFKL